MFSQENVIFSETDIYEGNFYLQEEKLFPEELHGIWKQKGR